MLVCALGDLTLDVVVRLRAPLAPAGDTPADIHVAPGGQAANVAAWVASLGARARLIGKTGADAAGELGRARLRQLGTEVVGPVEGRNGTICSLVDADGGRSMASDRAVAAGLRAEELDPAWLDGCNHLFVSGYALMREPGRSAAARAVAIAREGSATISVDLASWSDIRAAGPDVFRDAVVALHPQVVFATEQEADAVGGPEPGTEWIVKRGAQGVSFAGDERAALQVDQVVDTTGAGDALAAGWIVGGPELALEAAARCIGRMGAMP